MLPAAALADLTIHWFGLESGSGVEKTVLIAALFCHAKPPPSTVSPALQVAVWSANVLAAGLVPPETAAYVPLSSLAPTASAAIFALSTASFAMSALLTAPAAIFGLVTASSAIFAVPTAPS